MTEDVRYRLLGPIEAVVGDREARLGGARQRTLLAALLLRAGQVVATDTLIELVWGEAPPRTALTALHGLVSRLRRALDPGEGDPSTLISRAPGYVLVVPAGNLDLWECERLSGEGGRALADGDPVLATERFSQALSLWRGPALGGATAGTLALLEGPRLEELRLSCLEGRAEAELALGRHAELAPELQSLVAEHAFRERLRGQHMLALYRLGRRADALESYRAARARLVDELGLEPGPELRELQRAILADDPALLDGTPTPPALTAPDQLPPDVPDFTAREGVLAALREMLSGDALPGGPGAPPIVAVSGKPGVGKSALAVHAAHVLRERFPDGQLFAALHGVESGRVDPSEVLQEWLRALGAAPAEIPDELEARARAYRARLSGRRMLVVLDDAGDESQVRPLLPGTADSAVLCTSRRPLAGLEGARFVALEPLEASEALALLGRVCGDDRVQAEPAAAAAIATRCGGLPLALRVAGGRLAQRDQWSLSVLAERLQDAGRRLDELRVGDLEVRASVGLSYRALDLEDQRALRFLGLLHGTPFATWLAAAVLDASLADADRLLERLVDQQLIDVAAVDPAGQVRYRFHDVLADFARERLAEESVENRRAALDRALGASLEMTDALSGPIASVIPGATSRRAARWRPGDAPAPAQDQASAFRWFDAERRVLVAMVERACEEPGPASWELAANVSCGFEQGRRWTDWHRVLEAGLMAAERDRDALGQATSLRGLGLYHDERGEPQEAARCFEAALQALEDLDEPDELSTVLLGLADVRWAEGHPSAAVPLLERALALVRRLGDDARESLALYELGNASASLGRLGEAERLLRQAADQCHRLGDARGEAYAWHGLGYVMIEAGDPDEAARCYELSQRRADAAGDDSFVGGQYGLGYARRDQGRLEEAMRELRAAYAMAGRRGYRRAQMYALYGLGTTEHRRGRLPEAAEDLQRSWALAREIGDQRCAARALTALGAVRLEQSRFAEASTMLRSAVEIAEAGELRLTEACARETLARSLAGAGDEPTAADEREQARRIRRDLEAPRSSIPSDAR